jgi:hypothetical protein
MRRPDRFLNLRLRKETSMKKAIGPILVATLVTLALLLASRAMRGEETAQAAPVTLRGTVVDMHCYVTHGIHDAKHTACSNACIARGVPAGFLADDGTLYVLFEEKPFSVKDRVAGLADVPAVLTGIPVVRSGIRGIQVTSIAKAAS